MRHTFTASLIRFAHTTPDWSASNSFTDISAKWGTWVSGTTVSTRTAIGAGVLVQTTAPTLLQWPHSGSGFRTTGYTDAFVGSLESPYATPQLTISGNILTPSTSVARYPTHGGTGSLQSAIDSRETRVFRPSFGKQV
jgi:hypothetical protein